MEAGFEEIYSDTAYYDTETSVRNGVDILLLHMMYVPPFERGVGRAKEMFNSILAELTPEIQYIRLKSAKLGSGCTMSFWKSLGFTQAYNVSEDTDEGKILHLAVNGYKLPVPESIENGEERHYIFD